MDVNLRKTATDTAYVVVGVGVLGFQQAQVKRRDAVARVSAIGRDARSTLTAGTGTLTDSVKSRVEGCTTALGSNVASIASGTFAPAGDSSTRFPVTTRY